jgi:hypothetical protein
MQVKNQVPFAASCIKNGLVVGEILGFYALPVLEFA